MYSHRRNQTHGRSHGKSRRVSQKTDPRKNRARRRNRPTRGFSAMGNRHGKPHQKPYGKPRSGVCFIHECLEPYFSITKSHKEAPRTWRVPRCREAWAHHCKCPGRHAHGTRSKGAVSAKQCLIACSATRKSVGGGVSGECLGGGVWSPDPPPPPLHAPTCTPGSWRPRSARAYSPAAR